MHQEAQEPVGISKSRVQASRRLQKKRRLKKLTQRNKNNPHGAISPTIYRRAFQGSGGILTAITLLLLGGLAAYSSYNLSRKILRWGKIYFLDKKNNKQILATITSWLLTSAVLNFLKSALVLISALWFSQDLHSKMIFRYLHSKVIGFIQQTPTGNVLNIFSTDINNIDTKYGITVNKIATGLIGIMEVIITILLTAKSPLFLIPPVVFILIGVKLRIDFMSAKRELTRMALVSKSPIIGMASATIEGGPLIRALGIQEHFMNKMEARIDQNSKTFLLAEATNPWFRAKMSIYNSLVLMIPSFSLLLYYLYYVHEPSESGRHKGLINISIFLSKLVAFSKLYAMIMIDTSVFETVLISAERCMQYEALESEAGYSSLGMDCKLFENPKKMLGEATKMIRSYKRKNELESGKVKFKDLRLSYSESPDSDVILEIEDVKVRSGEKVAIVGRSGCGKSSFVKALWKAFENYQGELEVAGKNVREYDLKHYREQLNIVLQKPCLFEGTLLSNLSTREFTAEEVANLQDLLIRLGFPTTKLEQNGMGFKVSPEGSNLSKSELHIVSWVQALSRKDSKIVIVDEATAYVDEETEKKFQEVFYSRFNEATMFIVAHRLANIVHCDLAIVLGDGGVVEVGIPSELLRDQESEFYKLWKGN